MDSGIASLQASSSDNSHNTTEVDIHIHIASTSAIINPIKKYGIDEEDNQSICTTASNITTSTVSSTRTISVNLGPVRVDKYLCKHCHTRLVNMIFNPCCHVTCKKCWDSYLTKERNRAVKALTSLSERIRKRKEKDILAQKWCNECKQVVKSHNYFAIPAALQ